MADDCSILLKQTNIHSRLSPNAITTQMCACLHGNFVGIFLCFPIGYDLGFSFNLQLGWKSEHIDLYAEAAVLMQSIHFCSTSPHWVGQMSRCHANTTHRTLQQLMVDCGSACPCSVVCGHGRQLAVTQCRLTAFEARRGTCHNVDA